MSPEIWPEGLLVLPFNGNLRAEQVYVDEDVNGSGTAGDGAVVQHDE
jgi:hypothetical protein